MYVKESTTPKLLHEHQPSPKESIFQKEKDFLFDNFNFQIGVNIDDLVEKILEIQQPKGSFGGYTVSSLFAIIALDDYIVHHAKNPDKYKPHILSAYKYIEHQYFDTGDCSYLGALDDGHYWDTILAGIALVQSSSGEKGVITDSIFSAATYLAKSQVSNGGIPYGFDFEYAPDFDDTAELAILWGTMINRNKSEYNILAPNLEKAMNLLLDVQNSDGGWAAFDKNRQGNWLVKKVLSAFSDSAELFDPSCADIIGHVFEAIEITGKKNSKMIKKAVNWLKDHQEEFGGFQGRWGSNYIYGTGAVLVGIGKVGESDIMKEEWVVKATDWLVSKQNKNGSWGETGASYKNTKLAGIGYPTPSQTAWALLGLIEVYKQTNDQSLKKSIDLGVDWLISDFWDKGGLFVDESCVGTGHRGILMMQYLVYSYTWPLMTLGRYSEL